MAELNEKTVKNIANLSRINIDQKDIPIVAEKLSHIMEWVEKLQSVDVSQTEPMTSVVPMALKMRQDAVTDGGYPEIIVKNAPIKDGHFFCVPKVVE